MKQAFLFDFMWGERFLLVIEQFHDFWGYRPVLVYDGKIELGIVFGHRLVYATLIEHKLFLDLNNHELLNWLAWN